MPEPITIETYKLPAALSQKLAERAQETGETKRSILIRALERELARKGEEE